MTTIVAAYLSIGGAVLLTLLWALPRYADCPAGMALAITGATAMVMLAALLGLLRVLRGLS